MNETVKIRPWEIVEEFLKNGNMEAVKEHLAPLGSDEIVLLISHLSKEHQLQLLTLQSPEVAASIIQEIPEIQATDILKSMPASNAAAIIDELKSNEQADILGEFKDDNAEAIMAEMDPQEVANVRKLIKYDPDTAGGIMITELLAFDEKMTVRQVGDQLRERAEEYKSYNVQYIYVTGEGKFVGVLQMRDLVMTSPQIVLANIAIKNAVTVHEDASLDELINLFDTYDFYGIPVIDSEGRLMGLVMRKDVREEETELVNRELLETQGIVGGEELRTMPFLLRSRRRLSWLSVNILLNIMAASVIAFYEDTLTAAIALVVFLPIISDMSGCSGNQAVAVSLRELALGVVKPYEMRRVWIQELSVGIINGSALGLLLGFAAYLWKGSFYLGLVVGLALCLNTIIAVSIGGTIPLLLKKFNVDPALASGPILTTITDMVGFLLALSFATYALSQLGGKL